MRPRPAVRPARRRSRAAAVLLAALALLVVPAGAGATTVEGGCPATPTGDLPKRSPAALGFDEPALNRALDGVAEEFGGSFTVARHGCLAATRYTDRAETPWESFSTAKSVTSIAVGRAIRLGLLSLDDRVGGLLPEADAAHGDLTLRQLLNQVSGLHFNWVRDYLYVNDDHVRNALTLPVEFAPGTRYEYMEVVVSLVAEMVSRAAGESFATFLQREVLDRIGIPDAEVTLTRDRTGRAAGYWGVQTPERNWVRLGQLMLQRGAWNGVQLLDPEWMAEVPAGTTINPAYSMFFWTNRGDRQIIDTQLYRTFYEHPLAPYAPRDAYAFMGIGGQVVWVVPSLDLVVTRHGPYVDFDAVVNRLLHGVLTSIRRPVPVASAAALPWESAADGAEHEGGLEGGILGHALLDPGTILAGPQVLGTPLPPAGPRRGRALQVAERDATIGEDDRVPLTLRCPPRGQLPCRGTVAVARPGVPAGAASTVELARGTSAVVRLAVPRDLVRAAVAGDTIGAVATVGATTRDDAAGIPTAIPVRLHPPAGRLVVRVVPRTVPVGRTTRVRVTVRSRRGSVSAPVGATVVLGGRRVRTSAGGRARIAVRPSRPGRLRASVTAPGHPRAGAVVVARR